MKTPRSKKKEMNSEATNGTKPKSQVELTFSDAKPIEDKVDPKDMMEVNFDGPFGAPATNIFRAEHAVLGNFRQLFQSPYPHFYANFSHVADRLP